MWNDKTITINNPNRPTKESDYPSSSRDHDGRSSEGDRNSSSRSGYLSEYELYIAQRNKEIVSKSSHDYTRSTTTDMDKHFVSAYDNINGRLDINGFCHAGSQTTERAVMHLKYKSQQQEDANGTGHTVLAHKHTLNFSFNMMCDEQVANLADCLKWQKLDLITLNLSYNNITSKGVEPLFYQLSTGIHLQPHNIQHINLSNNQIGDYGANYIAQSLVSGRYPTTKHIDVSGNNIGDKGAWSIAEALKTGKFSTLKRFDASGNDISLVGEKFMLDALKHPSTQSVMLLLKRSNDLKVVLSGSKEEKQKLIKETLQTAQDNGVDVKNVAVSKGISGFLDNLGYVISDFALGFTKCNVVPEDAETFAIEAVTAKICKKTAAANAAKDFVVCLFDTVDEISTSPEGIQFIKDLDLLGANEVIDSIE